MVVGEEMHSTWVGVEVEELGSTNKSDHYFTSVLAVKMKNTETILGDPL